MHRLNPEASPNPRKTPIQILHEYGIKSGILPVYVMEKAEGEAHRPSFVFSVQIREITCTGDGQTHCCFASRLCVVVVYMASC